MTMHCIKDHNGRRGWDQRNSYPVGVTSKLKSGEDLELAQGKGGGGGSRDTQRPGSDGTFRNPWEVVFC